MKKKLALELNAVDLLKYALFKGYALPADLAPINSTQERILMTVKYSLNQSMVAIARAIGLEKGPFSKSVDTLEALQLLQRKRDSTDRRLIHLELTESGQLLTQQIEDHIEAHFASRIKQLTAEELQAFYAALSTLEHTAKILIAQ